MITVCRGPGRYSLALVLAMLAVASPPALAQVTTSQIVGTVTDTDGHPVDGAEVTITHVPTAAASVVTTRPDGYFSLNNVRIGGPFTVAVSKEGYDASTAEGVSTQVGRPTSISIQMRPALTEVVVASAREQELALGSGTSFSLETISEMPSIGRDIKDIARIDPKIWIDAANVDAMEIAGTNSKYNSINVDGIRQSDDFGLNNNGYPSNRSPVTLDAIEAFTVEVAPFDVQYSGFQGGSVNIVTKSGSNDFHGSAWYYKNQDSWAGDRSKDRRINLNFDEFTYGATLGGPILRDRLFFFLSYEKVERETPVDAGPGGAGFPVSVNQVSDADFNQIVSITQSVYGYDAGELIRSNTEEDERILAKLDWQIADDHRVSVTYQKNEGVTVVQPNASAATGRLGTRSNWYNRPINLENLSLQLFSNWTPWLTTELKAGRKEVTAPQTPVFGANFSEFQVRTATGGIVHVGPDEFRHANVLTNDLNTFKLKADMLFGDHTVTVGAELEQLDLFNQFVPRSLGQYIFNSIADYQNRSAASFSYSNAFTNNSIDGAAAFGTDTLSFYLQDAWRVTPSLTVQAGLRLENYSSGDKPRVNTNFATRYGFSNTETYDGRDLLLPRLGFDWEVAADTKIRGGVGLFGGGSPNVWLSNSFANDGVAIVAQNCPANSMSPTVCSAPAGAPIPAAQILTNVNGSVIPAAILAAQGGLSGDGPVNAIDPGFEIPSSWRYNLGVEHFFDLGKLGEGYRLSADLLYTTVKDQILYRDLRLQQTGTAPDGRPIYSQQGPSSRGSAQDLLLTNTSEGEAIVWTIDLTGRWNTSVGRFDAYLGYGHQDVKDVNPGTSSQASSNWDNLATEDPNNPKLARSNYEITHRFPLQLTWRKAFFGDYETNVGLFVERRSGRPFSYTFGSATSGFGDPRQSARQRQLLYVPLNPGDVDYGGGLTPQALEDFIVASGLDKYRGSIAPRNAFSSPWVTSADLRFSQEIPTFLGASRAVVSLDIENVANLINKDWGQLASVQFPYVAPVLNASINATTGRYTYSPLPGRTTPAPANFVVSPAQSSVWQMQLGIRFEF